MWTVAGLFWGDCKDKDVVDAKAQCKRSFKRNGTFRIQNITCSTLRTAPRRDKQLQQTQEQGVNQNLTFYGHLQLKRRLSMFLFRNLHSSLETTQTHVSTATFRDEWKANMNPKAQSFHHCNYTNFQCYKQSEDATTTSLPWPQKDSLLRCH